MTVNLLHFSDVENVYDYPERLARLYRTIEDRRSADTLVVGSGDNVAPSVLGLAEQGDHALAFFDALRPDVSTFGNHDFDFGPEAMRRIVAESPQEWISANLYEPPDDSASESNAEQSRPDDPPSTGRFAGVDPVAVRSAGDLRVGFVGVTDPASSIPPELVATDPVAAVRKHASDLRSKVDHVVVLAHLDPEQTNSVAALDDVDVVCAGHVHGERRARDGDTLLVRPAVNADTVWEVHLSASGTAPAEATRHTPTQTRPDRAIERQFRRRHEGTGLTDTVCTVASPLGRSRPESLRDARWAGTLVAEAYRWAVDGDVGYIDAAAIRDGPPLAGEIQKLELVGLVPFPGELYTVELSGAELASLVADARRPADGPDADDNETVWWAQATGVSGLPGDDGAFTVNGSPVRDEETYVVGTNSYVVNTDTFPAVTRDHVVESHGFQYEAVVEYARRVGPDSGLDAVPRP